MGWADNGQRLERVLLHNHQQDDARSSTSQTSWLRTMATNVAQNGCDHSGSESSRVALSNVRQLPVHACPDRCSSGTFSSREAASAGACIARLSGPHSSASRCRSAGRESSSVAGSLWVSCLGRSLTALASRMASAWSSPSSSCRCSWRCSCSCGASCSCRFNCRPSSLRTCSSSSRLSGLLDGGSGCRCKKSVRIHARLAAPSDPGGTISLSSGRA
mmetsp:Transcript_17604/g.55468  ORF Transcript_17604/g.55468 Transcript_17604/m.55468 type:complete len:217 (-) Transcript_17604:24-674(-)